MGAAKPRLKVWLCGQLGLRILYLYEPFSQVDEAFELGLVLARVCAREGAVANPCSV
jgi:hypothetical protein